MEKRDREIARLVKKAERVVRKPMGEAEFAASPESRSLQVALTALIEDESGEKIAGTAADYRMLSYLRGLENLDKGENQDAVLEMFPTALARYLESGIGSGSGRSRNDGVLANALFLLGREFLKYAQWDLACELFFHALVASPSRAFARKSGLLSLVCAYSSGDAELVEGMREQFEDVANADQAVKELIVILESTLPGRQPKQAIDPSTIWSSGPLVGVLTLERLSTALNGSGMYQSALLHGRTALDAVPDVDHFEWLRSALLQNIAIALRGLGRLDEALGFAIEAWDGSGALRYGNCDQLLRDAVWAMYAPSRALAFELAVGREDVLLVASLLEKDRLQGSLVPTLEYEEDGPDAAASRDSEVAIESTSESSAERSSVPESSGSSAPRALFTIMEHAMNSVRIVAPPAGADREGLEVTAIPGLWFGLARYGDRVFWALLDLGEPAGCGFVDLSADLALDELLLDLEEEVGGYSLTLGGTYRDRVRTFDAFYHLAEWGTAEERIATLTLGRLIPDILKRRLALATVEHPASLLIAAGAGLGGVPWPIIQLGRPDDHGFRILERAVLRHWISSGVERAKPVIDGSRSEPLPLLVAIDDPHDELSGSSAYLRANARHYFGSDYVSEVDSKTDIRIALHAEVHNDRRGLFYYRGHAHSRGFAANAALDVPGDSGSDDADDDLIKAGEFFGLLDEGHPLFPLPTRVVLSCCSSTTMSLLGGEAVGLAAASIVGGGAVEVIATGCDVADTPFTTAFDDLLASVMTEPRAHDVLLRELQVRMYDEWRLFSLRGGIDVQDVTFPHPMIWAMYQAL